MKEGRVLGFLLFFSSVKERAAAAAKSLQSCPTLCDPIDGSRPGSPVPGILLARTLEWVAISFSKKESTSVKKIHICLLGCLCGTEGHSQDSHVLREHGGLRRPWGPQHSCWFCHFSFQVTAFIENLLWARQGFYRHYVAPVPQMALLNGYYFHLSL